MSEAQAFIEILKHPFAGAIIFGFLSFVLIFLLLKVALKNARLELEKKVDLSIAEFLKNHSEQLKDANFKNSEQIKDIHVRIDNLKDQFHSSEIKIHQLILTKKE